MVKVNKFKLFIGNFLVYGLGSIISKLIPLIMVPIITRLMPDTTYFGLNDMSTTVASFASALAMMGMVDAIYRMFFEKEDEEFKRKVCSTGLIFVLATSIITFFVLLLCKDWIARFFFENSKYAYLVYLTAMVVLVESTNGIVALPTRMQNKRKPFLVINTLSPMIAYLISIPMLLNGYYVIALPLAAVVSALITEIIFVVLNHGWFDFRKFDLELLKKLLFIAIPLVPNFMIYWVFNSSDKIMITKILSVADSGIYSVGAKLGHASQLIYTAFAGGWQYFSFYTMKEEKQVKNNSLIYEYLGIISFVATMFISALSYQIYKLLFVGNYVNGYVVSPYLFLAPLLQMIYQVAANQFLIIKKTWPTALILLTGALFNVFGNLVLIPKLGIEGAAIASVLGYIISNIVVIIVLSRMRLMELNKKFILASLIMVLFMVIWRIFLRENTIGGMALSCAVTCIYVLLYREDLKKLLQVARQKK